MLPSAKIPPILPHTVTLNNPHSQKVFLCKHLKYSQAFHLNTILFSHTPGPNLTDQKRLSRIFKLLKSTKKISQDDFYLFRIHLPDSKLQYLIKKVQRIKALNLQDKIESAQKVPAKLDLWLKHVKSLNCVTYQFSPHQSCPLEFTHNFAKQINQSLQRIPRHNKLANLQIKLPLCHPSIIEPLLQFHKYPSSLKNFAIYHHFPCDLNLSSLGRVRSAFSRLKNLEMLTLSGSVFLLKVIQELLDKIPSLKKLKQLNSKVDGAGHYETPFSLKDFQEFKNLRELKVSGVFDDCQGLKDLETVPKLESLEIKGEFQVQGIRQISQFISLFRTSLKTFKLEILHNFEAQSPEEFQELFNVISQFENLTSLKIKVSEFKLPSRPLSLLFNAVTVSPTVLNSLQNLFTKSVKLESFEWEFSKMKSLQFQETLLGLLEPTAPTLKKLKISYSDLTMNKLLFNFLKKLKSIKKLQLNEVHIWLGPQWVLLEEVLVSLRTLRWLKLVSVMQEYDREWFTESLVKIAQKKGLEELYIDARPEAEMRVSKRCVSLKEIVLKNPDLQKLSDSLQRIMNTVSLEN